MKERIVMRRINVIVVLLTAASAICAQESVIAAQRRLEVDREKTKWVGNVIDTILALKPGMTRRDLLDIFMEEGGLSNRKRRTYVFKTCPYVKVDVEFAPVGNEEDLLDEAPQDKITKISRPYLQYTIAD